MKLTTVRSIYKDYGKYVNQEISIAGWIRSVRASNKFGFMEINDGSFFSNIQVVFNEDLANFDDLSKLTISSSVTVVGTLVATPDAKQDFEIQAKEVIVEGIADSSYPLQKKRHTFEYLRTIAHLRPRSNTFSAVFRVRSLAAYAIHKFFNEKDFVHVHTPMITGSDCEGAGEMFRLTTLDLTDVPLTEDGKVDVSKDFFKKETNLTVSGQLSAETYSHAFRDVYTFGPTFRAENSNTPRHAAEFWMMEPEMSFCDLEGNMDNAEEMIKYVTKYVMDNAPEELEFFNKFIDKTLLERLNNLVNSEFGRVTYTEAIEILKASGKEFEYPVEWGIDLQTEHERFLAEEHFKRPVFVTNYPKEIKAFYMRLDEDSKTVAAMDLLAPGIGEMIGGSQREERLDVLESRIKELGLNEEDYWWYLDLRKFGTVKHSGYGLGFARLVRYLTGMENIRDVIPFPRTTGSAEF
ncbi:MAG: asparagine--tRNA ligase [Clostridia bacterium]|jgi:asparaginyl-tRNA synthetase|nr:asparagine--tRNA ligase [Clostridia bacterium]